jgi:hypothetical protein
MEGVPSGALDTPEPSAIWRCRRTLFVDAADRGPVVEDRVVGEVRVDRRGVEVRRAQREGHD